MKKLVTLAAFTTVALFGCNTPNHIEGQLTVSQPLTINAKLGLFNQRKTVTVAPARYQTSLAMDQNGAQVRIHTGSEEVKFDVPQIRADAMGDFRVTESQIGQEFGLEGKLYSTTDQIDRIVHDQCVHHYDSQYVCHDEQICDRDGKNCRTQQRCGYEQVPVYGQEPVHELGSQDTKHVDVSIVKASRAAAQFYGSYTYSESISSRQVVGFCTL